MNISIFGLGYVGCVSMGCLSQNSHNVIGIDINQVKVDQINAGKPTIIEKGIADIIEEQHRIGRISATVAGYKKAVLSTDISIVSVGTPSSTNGHLDLTYVFNVAVQIAEALKEKPTFHIVIIRSTVTPGTCDKFADLIEKKTNKKRGSDFVVIANPEFMREGTAVHDYYNPPFILMGAQEKAMALKIAKKLYKNLSAEIIITDIRTSEIIKYVNNTYHALKVCFANEIGNVCCALGINSKEVMDIFTKDKILNISPYYFKPGFAYGGSCLPKDLKGLATIAHDLYVSTPVIEAIKVSNNLQIEKGIDLIASFNKRKLGFLGLSFKVGTDDLRNSPTVTLVETLLGKGYEIRIFDNNVNLSKFSGTNQEYIETHIPHLSKLLMHDPQDVLDVSEIIIVTTKETAFESVLQKLQNKMIIDFVGLDKKIAAKENYIGINW